MPKSGEDLAGFGAEPHREDQTVADAPTRSESARSTRKPDAAPRSIAEGDATPPTEPSFASSTTARDRTVATTATSLVSAAATMHLQDIRRTRSFTRIATGLSAVVAIALFFAEGDATARWVVLAGLGLVFATGLWLAAMLRDDEGYTLGRVLAFGFACVVGAYCAIYYFGLFSPALAVIPFGLYFFSIGQSFRGTLAIYVACAVVHVALSVGIVLGALADRGLVRADDLGFGDRTVIVVLVQVTFLATFFVGRATQRATVSAIEQHDKAVRGLAHREALLKEAREELARALRVGGVGRFTDDVLGSFKLGVLLGRGGMGEVYEALHVTSKQPAAVKVLQAAALAEPDAVRRFLREAKVAASLTVSNVVRVLEIGGVDAPVPFIAMERLRGEDLADLLRDKRRLAMRRVLILLREVGAGLEAARVAGIVHRDLKPRNLFFADPEGPSPTWKILDFGISKLASDDGGTMTREGVVGTPAYMAPEQAAGKSVTHRTDLYALGVIAYRALTGRPAFAGDSLVEVLYKVTHTMPPRPTEFVRLPAAVDLVLAIAMAKDPSLRFDTAAAFADALEAASKGHIDPTLEATGEAIVAKTPWSTEAG